MAKENLPPIDQERAVVQSFAGVQAGGHGRAHQHPGSGKFPRSRLQLLHRVLGFLDQRGLLQQIPGGIAHQEKLGEDDEVRL